MKWYAENQEILDKSARQLRNKDDEIHKYKMRIEDLQTEVGLKYKMRIEDLQTEVGLKYKMRIEDLQTEVQDTQINDKVLETEVGHK